MATAAGGVTTKPFVSRLATAGDSAPSSADCADAGEARRPGRDPGVDQQGQRDEQQQHRPPQRPGVGSREERRAGADHRLDPLVATDTASSWHDGARTRRSSRSRRRSRSRELLVGHGLVGRDARRGRQDVDAGLVEGDLDRLPQRPLQPELGARRRSCTSSRSVTPSAETDSTPSSSRRLQHVAGEALVGSHTPRRPSLRPPRGSSVEVGVVGDDDVEHGDRPQLASGCRRGGSRRSGRATPCRPGCAAPSCAA